MPFKVGQKKLPNAGRKKGTPNKRNTLVSEILEAHGINIVDQILVRLKSIPMVDQVKTLTSMLPYVYPKLTNVEHSGEIKNPFLEKTVEELEVMVKEKLNDR